MNNYNIAKINIFSMLGREEFFALARGGIFSTEELYEANEAYAICPSLRGRGAFKCERCGACCRRPWRVEASVYDVQRWISEKRLDILESLVYEPKRGPPQGLTPCEAKSLEMMCSELLEVDEGLVTTFAFALAASREGALVIPKAADGCVFHDGRGCAIYGTRPGVCAQFPDVRLFKCFAALVQ
jgi:Fe-S-cluster containining protein